MQPLITLIRIRNDGAPAAPDSPFHARYLAEFGPSAQFLEMPYPAYHTARDFALDFLDAVSRARGSWIHVVSDLASPEPGALSGILNRLAANPASDTQGAVL